MANPILPHPNMDFTPLDVLTAAELDQMVANIQYLTNFCKGLANGSNLDNGSVLPLKINYSESSTTNFNFQSTFSSDTGSMQLTLRRWGNLGFINGRLKCSGNIPTSTTTAITGIHSDYRPRQEVFWTVMGSSGSLARAIFDTSGNIKVNMLPSQGSTNYLQFGEVYLI